MITSHEPNDVRKKAEYANTVHVYFRFCHSIYPTASNLKLPSKTDHSNIFTYPICTQNSVFPYIQDLHRATSRTCSRLIHGHRPPNQFPYTYIATLQLPGKNPQTSNYQFWAPFSLELTLRHEKIPRNWGMERFRFTLFGVL